MSRCENGAQAIQVGEDIAQALLRLNADDRLGFLFGLLCSGLIAQGFDTEEKFRAELEKSIQLVVARGHLKP
jgi:hypothetical protein